MAKGVTKKTTWKKGDPRAVAAGKKGSSALPKEIKEARALNRIELERMLNEMISMGPEALNEKLKNPASKAIELIIARIVSESIKRGDEKRFQFLLDRLIGPVKQKISVDGGEDGEPVGIKISIEERKKLLK